jgi:F0F1-type ATP synthase membrane subunit b/b'
MLASAAARKAEIEQKLIAAQVSARQMRDITKERAMRSAAAAEQARNRAVGE